jgi:rabconnectin-3a
VASAINERLTKVGLPQLSGHEQIQLADIVECVGLVEKHRRSLDENGARFMLFFRQHALRKGRTNEMSMSWREIVWAYHSTSQDILVDFVSRQNHGTLRWEHARESGMFMWLEDHNALVSYSTLGWEFLLTIVTKSGLSSNLSLGTSIPRETTRTQSTVVSSILR